MTRDPGDGASCPDVEDRLLELALGAVGEPRRAALLAHVESCAACAASLADVVAMSDTLVHLAPSVEPPAGFESRAVARMGAPAHRRRTRPRRRLLTAGAGLVVAVLAGIAGFAAGRLVAPAASGDRTSGVILTASGEELGHAELDRSGPARIVLTMTETGPWFGAWTCQLQAGDGSWVEVGRWTYDEVHGGVWAAGVPDRVAGSRAMRILGSSGRVIATARLR